MLHIEESVLHGGGLAMFLGLSWALFAAGASSHWKLLKRFV